MKKTMFPASGLWHKEKSNNERDIWELIGIAHIMKADPGPSFQFIGEGAFGDNKIG